MKENLIKNAIRILIIGMSIGAGYFVSSMIDTMQQEKLAENENKKSSVELVAIVNLDEGVKTGEETTNYATTLLSTINAEYIVTGLSDARDGVESGKYSSYIIIPATFSESVEGINSTPEQIIFEYGISNNLKEEAREKAIYNIHEVYFTLNNSLSKIYTASVLEEFHYAQDVADTIMTNDKEDTDTLNAVKAEDMMEAIQLPELEQVENDVPELDLTNEFSVNTDIAQSIGTTYDQALTDLMGGFNVIKTQTDTAIGKQKEVATGIAGITTEISQTVINGVDDTQRTSDEDAVYNEKKAAVAADIQKYESINKQYTDLCDQLSSISGCVLTTQTDSESGVKTDTYTFTVNGIEVKIIDVREADPESFTGNIGENVDAVLTTATTGRQQRNDEMTALTTEYQNKIDTLNTQGQALLTSSASADAEDSALGEKVSGFDPFSYVNKDVINGLVNSLSTNSSLIAEKVYKQNSSYEEYIGDVYEASADNTQLQIESIQTGQEAILKKLENELSEAKDSRTSNNETNKEFLEDLTQLLPYTRVGGVENKNVYEYMANPAAISDKSETAVSDAKAESSPMDSSFFLYGCLVCAGIVCVIVIIRIVVVERKEVELLSKV